MLGYFVGTVSVFLSAFVCSMFEYYLHALLPTSSLWTSIISSCKNTPTVLTLVYYFYRTSHFLSRCCYRREHQLNHRRWSSAILLVVSQMQWRWNCRSLYFDTVDSNSVIFLIWIRFALFQPEMIIVYTVIVSCFILSSIHTHITLQ